MAKRQSINFAEGAGHAAPIPSGSKIGSIVFSSAIGPRDPDLGRIPEDADAQAAAVFKNVRRFMEAAGGTTDNIIKMRLLLSDDKYREPLNNEWLQMFPDENSRPARHAETLLRVGQGLFQVEVIAVVD